MLSSTVLVSTATTPTGIPPSLVTCETNQNSYFYCYTTRHLSNLHQNTHERQIMQANGGRSILAFLKSLGMWLTFRVEFTVLKAKSSPKN